MKEPDKMTKEELLEECSHLAANICPHSAGDEHGHQYCLAIEEFHKVIRELIPIAEYYKGQSIYNETKQRTQATIDKAKAALLKYKIVF
jgi:hypothetical protein